MAKSKSGRRRKSSSFAPKKRSKKIDFECIQCHLVFSTKNELVDHAKHSTNSLCFECLHRCPHCGELWPSLDQMERHQRTNRFCLKKQKLPDSMSMIGPSEGLNINYESIVYPSTYLSNEIASSIEIGNSKILSFMQDIPKPANEKTASLKPKQFHHSQPQKVAAIPPLHDQKYTLNLNHIKRLVSSLPSDPNFQRDIFFVDVFDRSKLLKNGFISGTFRDLSIEINDIAAMISLEEDINDICIKTNSTYSVENICEEDMLQFITDYCSADSSNTNLDIEVNRRENPENEQSTQDTTNDDIDFFVENDDDEEDSNNSNNQGNQTQSIEKDILELSEEVNELRKTAEFETSELAMIELNKLLRNSDAPLYLFGELTKWCQKYTGAFDNEIIPSRDQFIKDMADKIYGKRMTEELVPIIEDHELPSGHSIKVTRFSFKSKLRSLLLNDDLMDPNNLLLDVDNPCQKPLPNQVLGDLNTGWWHRETFEEICIGPDELLLPLILFIDGGKVTERMNVEPITFTLGIFNRETRNKAEAWRTMGYIENLDNSDKSLGEILNSAKKLNDYHSMVKLILNEMKGLLGRDKGFRWTLTFNGKKHRVIFKLAIQLIIGDCQGLDKVCGQYGSHHPSMKKLCRDCFVAPRESDDPYYICKFVTMEDVRDKNKKELNLMSMHKIDNAFHDLYFGARTLSVFECTPPEPLHGILLGTFKYMYDQFEIEASKDTIRIINMAIRHFYRNFSKQSSRGYPTLAHVQNGVNDCGVLSAKEQYGRMFGIYLSLLVPEVMESLSNAERKRLADPTNNKKGFTTLMGMGKRRAEEWFMLIESSLTMYQWLMNPFHPPHLLRDSVDCSGNVIECRAQSLLRKYMDEFKYLVGNRKGNGLKIVKFHQILHYTPDIRKDGSILNWDSGRCESIAVSMYKLNAKRTQRRQKLLTQQISKRHLEDIILDEAERIALKKCPNFVIGTRSREVGNILRREALGGSRYFMSLDFSNQTCRLSLRWKNPRTHARFNKKLSLHIAKRLFFNPIDGGCLTHSSIPTCFTEYKDENGILYRAHPNYKSDGQWYDWCKIRWEGIDDPLPAKIIAFIDLTSCTLMNNTNQDNLGTWLNNSDGNRQFMDLNMDETEDEENMAGRYMKEEYLSLSKWVIICSSISEPVNESNNSRGTFAVSSKIAKRFSIEDRCRMVPLDCIVAPCYCIPMSTSASDTKCKDFAIIDKMNKWSSAFVPEE